MNKLQKFKDLLSEIESRQALLDKHIRLSSLQFVNQEAQEIRKLKKQLIQMYADEIKED